MARVQPIPGVPALRVPGGGGPRRDAVVVADLHLGLGANAERPLGAPGADAPGMARDLLGICREAGVADLIVAGDVKHPIVGTPPWLRPVLFDFFGELLARRLRVTVVLGNHDVDLVRHLPREVTIVGPEGAKFGDAGIFHGHRWPSDVVRAAPTLVVGHLHPGYRFAPSPRHPDGKHPCWVRAEFPPPKPSQRGRPPPFTAREMVVLPAFHPLAGTEALNRRKPARGRSFLYGRFLSRGIPRAYLFDGSDLGPLPTEPAGPARRAPTAAARS